MAEETPNSMDEMQNLQVPCPECQTGAMRLQYLTYFTWLNEELVTVPNFPAWVCDLCGRREYDHRAVTWLNMLLNPETGRPTPRQRIYPHRNQPLPPPVE